VVPSLAIASNVSPSIGFKGFSNKCVGGRKAIVDAITLINLSNGSCVYAAAFKYSGYVPTIVPMSSSIDLGHIHLIGKLIVVRLNFPLNIYLPMLFKTSLPADLNLLLNALSDS